MKPSPAAPHRGCRPSARTCPIDTRPPVRNLPAMFLHKLEIEDFRSIEKMEVSFAAADGGVIDRTVVVGENGTGKSSVLRAAGLVMAGSEALAGLLTEPGSWIRNGKKMARLAAELRTAEGEKRNIQLTFSKNDGMAEVIKKNAKGLAPLDAALKHSARSYFVAGYGASRRLSEVENPFGKSERSMSPRALSMATLFDPSATMKPLEAWAANLHYQKGAAGLALIRNSLKPVLRGMTLHSLDKQTHRLIFDTPDGRVPLRQLSDGFQNMVAWCGDLLARLNEVFEDYKDPFSSRGLLLVDEIDLHLHPQWQRMLLDFLRTSFPNFQLIATSHSPLTVQQCGPGEVVTITRADGGKGAPEAIRYQADLRRLRVEQVAASPIFGLGNTLSVEAGKRMDKRSKPKMATASKNPASILSDLPVPDFQYLGAEDRKRIEVLQQIAAKIGHNPLKPPPRRHAAAKRAAAKRATSNAKKS